MSEQHPLVSIITVNYNQLAVTCALLDSVPLLEYPRLELIVVDNHSTENPAAYLRKHYPEVRCLVSPVNLGFAGGNNLGIAQARGEYLFFVNNDTVLTPGLLHRLLHCYTQVDDLGVVCPKICYHGIQRKGKDVIQYAGATPVHPVTGRNRIIGEREVDGGQYAQAMPTAYAHGAAMLVSRAVIERVGPMPEDYFLYYEELDWCEQIRAGGFQIYVEPRAKIYHKESISVGRASPFKTYFLTRNRLLFMRRNKSGLSLLLFFLFMTFVAIPKNVFSFLLKGEFQHLRAFLAGIWWNIRQNLGNESNELSPAWPPG